MKIPRILHFIHLGPAPLPAESRRNMLAWEKLHPGWRVVLWDDRAAARFTLRNWREYASFNSFAAKSDILRLEVLREMGGVYCDGDMEPRKNIESLIEGVECFVGYERDGKLLNNAIIGSTPNHPSICAAISNLPLHLACPHVNHRDAAYATGPFFVARCWLHDSRVTKFPRRFFYPYDWNEPWRANEAHEHAVAIHRWRASWVGEVTPPTRSLGSPHSNCLTVVTTSEPCLEQTYSMDAQSVGNFARRRLDAGHTLFGQSPRILFVPSDHVLDRNTVEQHALLPENEVGIGFHRSLSAAHRFDPSLHTEFPFAIYESAGLMVKQPRVELTGTASDFDEVASISARHLRPSLRAEPDGGVKRWLELAQELGATFAPVWTTFTTKLLDHDISPIDGNGVSGYYR